MWVKYTLTVFAIILVCGFLYMKATNQNISEVGLSIFSLIKKIRGKEVQVSTMKTMNSIPVDHTEWSNLLALYVSTNGNVDYEGFVKDKERLATYLAQLSQNPPQPNFSKEEKLSYWINAYNAFTVQLIIDHYPLKSIKDISSGLPMINSPWDIPFFKIGEIDFDLNTIEHKILRQEFDEPRIHFAINCASFSCPKLRNEAYLPELLESQLEDQTKDFIHDPSKNQISKDVIQLSSIFNWFQSDFTKNGSLISFIQQYHPTLPAFPKIDYLDYNWSLNN